MHSAIEQFRNAIRAAGLNPPEVIAADGKLRRFGTNGKRSDDAGWYIAYADGIPAGAFGDWRTGISQNWRADVGRKLTPAEEAAHREQVTAMRQAREAEEAKRRKDAARKAGVLWKAATPAAPDHPYLAHKDVAPVATLRELPAANVARIIGYRPAAKGEQLAGRILLASVEIAGELSTIEMIDGEGRKSALASGTKAGGFWAAQALPDDDGARRCILIAEGVATALSASEATGHPAIAALSAGQLASAARAMRDRFPAAQLAILADVQKASGEPDPHALEAARDVGAALAVPDFGAERPEGATDFNDMAAHRGREAVKRTIDAAIASARAADASDDDRPTNVDSDGQKGSHVRSPSVPSEADVTAVTAVQASTGAASHVTAGEPGDVTGVTPSPIPGMDERPRFVVLDDWVEADGRKYWPGVWHLGVKHGRSPDNPPALIDQWVCSPLHVEAVTHDLQEGNFGRLLRFQNTNGHWREWAMPMELLRAAGDELRGALLEMGVLIDPSAHRLLGQFLQSLTPKRRVRCALQVGWCGDSFVLPDEVIGPAAANVTFQSGERGHDEYTRKGTLAGWQAEIAARAVGNPLLALGIAAAFAGPLLARCDTEGGGIHFVGDSSTGKTTVIEAACSVWGGSNYRRSWRATANGIEGAAVLSNDCLLALDEISECDPREVGAIVYALGNGRGKQRASRTGAARGVASWRCMVLSSGERTLATSMAEGGRAPKAGQAVRLLDVPAARRYGAWDTLHCFADGPALSDAIKRAAIAHYGHAGRAFLHRLTHDTRNLAERLERIKALPEFAADGKEGQDKRAAARFALAALAGELATEYGVTGWPEGEAVRAAAEAFRAWQAGRGHGNDERRQIPERVAEFIERHGDSRFSDAARRGDDAIRINRAGWWRDTPDGRVYLFTSAGLKEALQGFDFKRALGTLQEVGALPASSGERSRAERIDGRLLRVYPIHFDRLRGGDGS